VLWVLQLRHQAPELKDNVPLFTDLADAVKVSGGTFRVRSGTLYTEERPAHGVAVCCFWVERVFTNADFAPLRVFADHARSAERPLDPAVCPDARPDLLTPASATFRIPSSSMRPRERLEYIGRPDWQHPTSPGSTLAGQRNDPVLHVSYGEVGAYVACTGEDVPIDSKREFAARGRLDPVINRPGRWPRISPAYAREWRGPSRSRVRAAFVRRSTT
jgi:sulfatase modifying factor 1